LGNKKKKSRRDKQEYPALDPNYNLKLRRDYIDNRYYVNGVKQNGETVMPALDKDAKKYLNDFNREYYNASFKTPYDYDNIHICKVDKEDILDIKSQIRDVKALRKKIFNKSPNTTTEEDREAARHYNKLIEDMEDFLDEVHPRRSVENANNDRNRDLLNRSKASNMYDLVSWEELLDMDLLEAVKDDDEEWE